MPSPSMPTMRTSATIRIIVCIAILSLGACSLPKFQWPRVHKITVQQGNVITQKMVDRLKPGMTRSQVVYVMGEPVLQNPFNNDRWDYVYTIEVPGVAHNEQRLSLFFENDVLASFSGNYLPEGAATNDPVNEEDIIPDPEPDPESASDSEASADS